MEISTTGAERISQINDEALDHDLPMLIQQPNAEMRRLASMAGSFE